MNYYIYLDDVREDDTWFRQHLNAEHWIPCIVHSYNEAIHVLDHMRDYINENEVLILDLDHDLGKLKMDMTNSRAQAMIFVNGLLKTSFSIFIFISIL